MRITLIMLVILAGVQKTFALDPAHFTITRVTAPYFIVDGNAPTTITRAYVGFEVRNTSAVTYTGLKFTITSIGTSVAGQNYVINSPASGVINVGTLAPGQSKVCYYNVTYPAHVTAQGTFNVLLSDNTTQSKTQAVVIRNRSTISANAGGTATQSFTNQDIIGGLVIDDVTYVVGNTQNGDESDFQVAVSPQFDPTRITLINTRVTASSIPGIPVGTTDSLYFITGSGSNGATVTIRWTFRITGYNFTNYLLPCAGATSGSTNYKYALNTALGSGSPVTISASANPLTITKTSDWTVYSPGAEANFAVTIGNPGAYGVTVDRIADQLPAGFSFLSILPTSQVTADNSTTVPASGSTGAITFEGGVANGSNTSYYIPAGGNIVLRYKARAPLTLASNLSSTVRDYIGTTEVGSATNVVSVSTTLPLSLQQFTASLNGAHCLLAWITSNEQNTSHFSIERADGSGTFQPIGEVAAAGNSALARHYDFTDSFPVNGVNRYRLNMVDRDGRQTYSPIVFVRNNKTEKELLTSVFPTPFTSQLTTKINLAVAGQLNYRLIDANGKTVRSGTVQCTSGASTIVVTQLENIAPGMYVFEVISGRQKSAVQVMRSGR